VAVGVVGAMVPTCSKTSMLFMVAVVDLLDLVRDMV
jgi:hypothetical protein